MQEHTLSLCVLKSFQWGMLLNIPAKSTPALYHLKSYKFSVLFAAFLISHDLDYNFCLSERLLSYTLFQTM